MSFGWRGLLRFVACVVAAALWLGVSYSATYVAYQLGNEIEDCTRIEGSARPVGVDGNWPSLKHTCVYERADGSTFRESDYAPQITVLTIGVLFGLVPAATFLWVGVGRPPFRGRGSRGRMTADGSAVER